MIKIERDYQNGTGDKFKVTASDKGYGRWSVKQLSLEAALETVKHYYGVNHNAKLCGHCKERPKRVGGLCQCARGSVLPNACIDRLRDTGKHKEAQP